MVRKGHKFSAETRAKMSAARLGKKLGPPSAETRAKIAATVRAKSQANAKDPEWRRKVSEATKERMQDSDIRERHLAGLKRAFEKNPNGNNFTGGFGQEPNALEKSYDWLCEIGYVHNLFIVANGRRYQLDYALISAQIAIEIDGSSHRVEWRQSLDRQKDRDLKSIGWKVIRVRHW